jgi:DAK2 domain fusion protein YloV
VEDDTVLHVLDARALSRWYTGGLAALDASRDEINSLNVFPVPDRDTGTNLYLTLASAAGSDGDGPACRVDEIARRCLLGAQGSSGVILSQFVRGVTEVLIESGHKPRGSALAAALEQAVSLGYAAVSRPVEGTMLTVARAAAQAARDTGSDELGAVVEAAAEAARRALADTPRQLDVLAQAGVVDAGGRGVVVLLDALQAVVQERTGQVASAADVTPGRRLPAGETSRRTAGYEVMYLLDADDEAIPELRRRLNLVDRGGDSVVVSGGDGLWHVHVHTDDAGAAVEIGSGVGRPYRVKVTPLPPVLPGLPDRRVEGPAADRRVESPAADRRVDSTAHAVVVLAPPGSPLDALRAVFDRNGAMVCRPTAALPDEVAGLGAGRLVLLADSAAGDAASAVAPQLRERGMAAEVVSAASPVQLVAALAVHDPARPFDDDVLAMCTAAAATRHGAVRPDGSADGDGVVGEFDALPPLHGRDAAEVALALLDRMVADDAELVTIVAEADCGLRIETRLDGRRRGLEVVRLAADVDRHVWLGVE